MLVCNCEQCTKNSSFQLPRVVQWFRQCSNSKASCPPASPQSSWTPKCPLPRVLCINVPWTEKWGAEWCCVTLTCRLELWTCVSGMFFTSTSVLTGFDILQSSSVQNDGVPWTGTRLLWNWPSKLKSISNHMVRRVREIPLIRPQSVEFVDALMPHQIPY